MSVIPAEVNDTCVDQLSQYQPSKDNLETDSNIILDEDYENNEDDDHDEEDDDQEQSLSKTEKWHKYKADKRYVKSYLGQKIAFGTNSLLIRKITGKFINMIETQNGLVHEHRRHDMAGTVKYIDYKKSILSRPQSNVDSSIDMSKQTPGYHQQLANIHEMQDEIKYLIDLMHQQSQCKLIHNIVFNHDVVQVNLEDESTINIFFRYDENSEKLAVSHNIDMSNIVCSESLQLITFLQKISSLVIDKTTKAGLEFQNYMSSLYWGQLQLEKLTNHSEEFEVDNTIKADIVQHIEKSKVGDKLVIMLGEHVHKDIVYTRIFVVKKLTKVRTIVELLAQSSEGEIIEYRTTIMKIAHNITENTDRILTIHNALK